MTSFCVILSSHLLLGGFSPPSHLVFSVRSPPLSELRVLSKGPRGAGAEAHIFGQSGGICSQRKSVCAINEKKATDCNLQIIWQKQRERDVAALFPAASWEVFSGLRANSAFRKGTRASERGSTSRPFRSEGQTLLVPTSPLPGPSPTPSGATLNACLRDHCLKQNSPCN